MKWIREVMGDMRRTAIEVSQGKAPAELPERYVDRKVIKYMQPGDERWTLPWAVTVDPDMRVWINGEYPAERQPGGTVQMLIRCGEDGIEILRGMEPQRPRKGIPWVGAESSDLLPVVKIH